MKLKDLINIEEWNYYDPATLPDIKESYELIKKAVDSNKNIFISGDFDCDGICSTSMIVLGLRDFLKDTNTSIIYRTPEREEGHQFPKKHINYALKNNCSLIITTDSASNDIDPLTKAQEKGLDIIVTDHHQITIDESKVNYPLVNPLRGYSDPYLCGSGVVYKFLEYGESIYWDIDPYLKRLIQQLTLIGTVADMVPMKKENLYFINSFRSLFSDSNDNIIDSLVTLLGRDIDKGKFYSWNICPTINAAGRFGFSNNLIQLIVNSATEFEKEAKLGEYIALNAQRKVFTQEWIEYVEQTKSLEKHEKMLFIVNNIPSGVKRLIANNYVDDNTPLVLAGSDKNDILSFSVTNKTNINFVRELQDKEYILNLGGHIGAFGIAYKKEDHSLFIEDAKKLLSNYKEEQKTEGLELDLSQDLLPLARELDFVIWGSELEEPIFTAEVNISNIFFLKGKHMKIKADKYEALKWNYTNKDRKYKEGKQRIYFTLSINSYKGKEKVNLFLI